MARPRSVVAIWRSAGASFRICSQHSKNMRRPEAPTGCPKDFSPPSGLIGRSPSRSNVPASTSFHAVPRGAKPRSSMRTSSVGVKQSCTSAMASCRRGSVMPACA